MYVLLRKEGKQQLLRILPVYRNPVRMLMDSSLVDFRKLRRIFCFSVRLIHRYYFLHDRFRFFPAHDRNHGDVVSCQSSAVFLFEMTMSFRERLKAPDSVLEQLTEKDKG